LEKQGDSKLATAMRDSKPIQPFWRTQNPSI
jgi:hypothetical protein